jgi:hypothetical protein
MAATAFGIFIAGGMNEWRTALRRKGGVGRAFPGSDGRAVLD